jgi:hypothetical protein
MGDLTTAAEAVFGPIVYAVSNLLPASSTPALPASGTVAGPGGYLFDAQSGLSKDSRLPYQYQDLTPAQLQTALNGGDPSQQLNELLYQDLNYSGAGTVPNGGGANQPNQPSGNSAIPTWVWVAALGVLGGAVFIGVRR